MLVNPIKHIKKSDVDAFALVIGCSKVNAKKRIIEHIGSRDFKDKEDLSQSIFDFTVSLNKPKEN